jgi:nucleoside-diphosphate-sugar epimerase
MKVLVTGGAGYIGSVLVPELLKKRHQVRVLDNLMYEQNPLLLHFIDDNFEFIEGDIRDNETVKKAVDGVDVIVHLAAIVGAPACKKNKVLAEEVNYQGTVNVNNARGSSQKLLYASTGSVYGKVEDICTEASPTNPLSVYGITKLKAEKEVMQKSNAIAYRFATAFGLSPRLRLDLLPNDFVFSALKNRYLVVYDKDLKRTFIHVRDIVRAYLFGIENFDKLKNEVYNIGSEKMNKTKEEIVKIIGQKINFEVYFADKGIPDPDQRDYAVSYQKILKMGFDTEITFEKGIEEMARGLQGVRIKNPFSDA